MTFTTVPWATTNLITEVKLDQMVDNDTHVRAEIDRKIIASDFFTIPHPTSGTSTPDYPDVTVNIGGVLWWSPNMNSTARQESNDKDISGDVGDIQYVGLSITDISGDPRYYFYVTADLNYLSMDFQSSWYTMAWYSRPSDVGGYQYYNVAWRSVNFTIIGHRVAKDWTW